MRQVPKRWMALGAVAGGLALAGAGVGAWAAAGSGPRATSSTITASTTTRVPAGGTTSTGVVRPTIVPGPTSGTVPATSVPGSTSSTIPRTTVPGTPPATVVLTQSSAGQTVELAVGQHVQVVLPGTGAQYQGFTTPTTDDAAVAAPDGLPCAAPSGSFCTEFVAKGSGSARLTATRDAACRQSVPPCEVASQVWWADLRVS